MSEEKRFDAPRSRLARARREGDAPRSNDLASAASCAAAALAVALAGAPLAATAARALAAGLRGSSAPPATYASLATLALAPATAAAVAATLATVAQGGLAFRLRVRPESLNPAAGIRRIASRDAAIAGAKAALAGAMVAAAVAPTVRDALVQSDTGGTSVRLLTVAGDALRAVTLAALACAAAFACVDVLLERNRWRRRLRMSFDELKREHRQSEGDPLVRGRRRRSHRALVRTSVARVSEAAFVVANPTHVAVGFAYDPPAIAVPRAVVRAVDDAAREVRRRAEALRIPVVEDAPLARALFAATALDAAAPPSFYDALARIVAALCASGTLVS